MSMLVNEEYDERLRASALAYLRAVQLRTGGPIRHVDVSTFEFDGTRIPLMDAQRGIRKPRMLEAALSFRTVFSSRPDQRPYADDRGVDGYLRYNWRGTDARHSENVALRRAMEGRLPLVWFQGIARGLYLPVFPVWLVDEEPDQHQFVVASESGAATHMGRLWRHCGRRITPCLCGSNRAGTPPPARIPRPGFSGIRQSLRSLPPSASRVA